MRIWLLALVVMLVAGPTARADVETNRKTCERGSPAASVRACSWLLTNWRVSPPTRGAIYRYRGNAYIRLSQFETAIRDFNHAIRLNPRDARAYNNRGIAFLYLKRYWQALRDYSRAVRLDPRHPFFYNNRGSAYFRLGQYRQAIAQYNHALRLNPRLSHAYHGRGLCFDRLKQHDRALRDYDQAIRLNPRFAKAYFDRGQLYQYVLRNRRQAIADYRAAYKLQPSNSTYAARLRELGVEP